MRIGVPTEIKANESRVGLTPESVAELVGRGHEIIVESGAGRGIHGSDSAYEAVGATIVPQPGVVSMVDLPFIRTAGSGLFEDRRPTPGPGGGPPPPGRFLSP